MPEISSSRHVCFMLSADSTTTFYQIGTEIPTRHTINLLCWCDDKSQILHLRLDGEEEESEDEKPALKKAKAAKG
ncbi:unnamed protein product [Microthlaspi erraticum]|uniref:Uncharacterized protein n=1 Tax=Microthlaspi erraticum TaxID=1685480 RepID=A0A6D2JXV3_9BRAS|nr:unnamed protein product [Microthlaspi erraticum]